MLPQYLLRSVAFKNEITQKIQKIDYITARVKASHDSSPSVNVLRSEKMRVEKKRLIQAVLLNITGP